MRLLSAFLLLLLACGANAQSGADLGWVKGTVKDRSTGEGLPFVKLIIGNAHTADTTVTDFDGSFVIRWPKEHVFLYIVQEGYLAFKEEFDIGERMVFINADLEPQKVFRDKFKEE